MWTYIPNESSDFALVSGCWKLESNSPCPISESKVELWACVSGKVSPKAYCWRGWRTRAWSGRLFATVSAILTNGGADALIGSWLDFPVNRGPALGKEKAKPTNAGFGRKSLASLTACNPDSASLKMSPDSALAFLSGKQWLTEQRDLFDTTGLTPFSERWPKEGSMQNGRIYLRQTLAQATSAKEFSSSRWTTPQAHDVTARGSGQTYEKNKAGNACLATDAKQWPTPDCNTSTYSNGVVGPNIREAAAQWQTPNAQNVLTRKQVGDMERQDLRGAQAQKFSLPAQTPASGLPSSPPSPTLRRRLNPAFANWLQGNPWWWTRAEPMNCAASEIKLWRSKLRLRLWNFCGE